MIARHRGEHDAHGLWQPRREPPPKPRTLTVDSTEVARQTAITTVAHLIDDAQAHKDDARRSLRRRARHRALLLVCV